MKIIAVDNFDRETVSDILVCEGIKSEMFGIVMVDGLNNKFCNHSSAEKFFKMVPDNHKLYEFKP